MSHAYESLPEDDDDEAKYPPTAELVDEEENPIPNFRRLGWQ